MVRMPCRPSKALLRSLSLADQTWKDVRHVEKVEKEWSEGIPEERTAATSLGEVYFVLAQMGEILVHARESGHELGL